jgi:HTH-type transcriptional regulator, sugar sensing transcriptional regulator
MATDFGKLFVDLGLSPSETNVYLASLKLGPTSILEIAKRAKLSRTATYDVVASLLERGLMSTFERGKKKFFSAEDPERAVTYFKGRMNDFVERIDTLDRSVKEMKMMAGGERPAVRFFEGREALHSLFADLVAVHPKELLELANIDAVYDGLDPKILLDARKALDDSKVKIKMLHRGEIRNPRKGAEYCRLLSEFGDFSGEIWIYGDRVAFVQFVGKMITVIIESQSFADMAKVLFKAAWAVCRAEPYAQKRG